MAFYKIGHSSLLDALRLMNPGVEVPSADQLSTTLLDRAYTKSLRAMEKSLSGKVATLVTDAWTDINGQPVMNYVVVCGENTHFLESVYTGAQAHDTEYLAVDIERVIAKYSFLKVGAVVTDNTRANQATWKALKAKFPKTFFHGCVCHAMHLLVKDIVVKLKWMSTLHDGCKQLVVFFRKHHKMWTSLSDQLKAKKLRLLAKPGDTRWGSLLECFNTILAAESILFSTVSARKFLAAKTKKQKKKRREVYDLVTSDTFLPRLKKAVAVLKPIGKILKRFERNETPLSEVYHEFCELPTCIDEVGLTANDTTAVKALIEKRLEFVYGEAHGLAYLLDPRYEGVRLDAKRRGDVENSLCQWAGTDDEDAVMLELASFNRYLRQLKNSTSRQWILLRYDKLPIFEFWCGLSQFPLLQKLALQVFRCAPSSAASERNFSTHAFIHSKLRNRLAPHCVEKLVHIFFNAKNVSDEDLERYSHLEDLLRDCDDEDEDENVNNNRSDEFVYF